MWIRYGLEIEKAYPRQARLWELCEWWGSSASSEWSATLLVFKVWSIPCIRSYIILILIIIMIRPGTSLGWSFSSCSSPFSSSPASFSTLSRTDLVLRDGERKPSLGRMKKSIFSDRFLKSASILYWFSGISWLAYGGPWWPSLQLAPTYNLRCFGKYFKTFTSSEGPLPTNANTFNS